MGSYGLFKARLQIDLRYPKADCMGILPQNFVIIGSIISRIVLSTAKLYQPPNYNLVLIHVALLAPPPPLYAQ